MIFDNKPDVVNQSVVRSVTKACHKTRIVGSFYQEHFRA